MRYPHRGPASSEVGLAVLLVLLAAFVAFAIYSGTSMDAGHF